MALKTEIQAVVASMVGNGTATPPSFIFGTQDEINVLLDDVNLVVNETKIVYMLSMQTVDNAYTNNNSINNSFNIFLFFGFKIDFGDDTEQCEILDVQVISMINEFMIRLKNYRGANNGKVFEVNVGDSSKSIPLFNDKDSNLYGRYFTMDLKTFYNEKLCF